MALLQLAPSGTLQRLACL